MGVGGGAFAGIWKGSYRVFGEGGSGSHFSHSSPEGRAEHVGMQEVEQCTGFTCRFFSAFKYLCSCILK